MEWTFEENKAFENALAEISLDTPLSQVYHIISQRVPRKTSEQIKQHFDALFKDIEMIELGNFDDKLNGFYGCLIQKKSRVPRRKGNPWSDIEHEAFLAGLQKYGKGDWKSISRNSVRTKSPTQVASHAQKYYLKLEKFGQQYGSESGSEPAQTFNIL